MIDWEEIIWNGVAWHGLNANVVPMLIDEDFLIDIRMSRRQGYNELGHQALLVITEPAKLSGYTNWGVCLCYMPQTFCDQRNKK